MRTWDHACIHVLMFMCAVWKVLWVLAVTLSLVSCSVSPRRRNTIDGHVVIGVVSLHHEDSIPSVEFFPSGFCNSCCSQTVFCDRQLSSVAN